MIRSLSRGLDILAFINKHHNVSPGFLAKELKVPRATVYRILNTLTTKGFIYQHESDGQFRMTEKVRTLSYGFTQEYDIDRLSKDLMKQITEELVWPVSLAAISGIDLVVRENTDEASPLAVEKFAIGYRMPILSTASGICILSFMDVKARTILLNMLAQVNREQDREVHNKIKLNKLFRQIEKQGYATHDRQRDRFTIAAISVPIRSETRIHGALTLRYSQPALTPQQVITSIVPKLTEAAKHCSERLSKLKQSLAEQ
jgi:IclR family mhp operon transcriptional activator